MFDLSLASRGLWVISTLAFLTWVLSLIKRDVSIVDSVWSLFFMAATLYWWREQAPLSNGPRAPAVLLLVGLWSLRLAAHLTWRNWGQPEDRRYQAIRARNQPGYELKSLVYVFALQALLAWVIAWPILAVLKSPLGWHWLDGVGIALFCFGLLFESVADWQMADFKRRADDSSSVMNQGLWRYSRHPNYFGESLVWWGLFLLAAAAGAPAWMIVSPVLITFLLIKVSGVPLLEQTMVERRPAYQAYIEKTSAFIPLPPKS
jgi:steroid 5-alpha reductase family enzyme